MPTLRLLLLVFAPALLWLTGCQSPYDTAASSPDAAEEDAPPQAPHVADAPTPTPEPAPDYVLKIGDVETTMAKLEDGEIDKDQTVTVLIDSAVAYERVVEVLTRISELGYNVQFAAP